MLLNRVLKFFITVFTVIIGATLLEFASPVLAYIISAEFLQINLDILDMTMMNALSILIGGIIGGSIGFISSSYCINKLRIFSIWVERQLSKMPTHDVVAGVLGLAIGLILANLLGVAFSRIPLIGPKDLISKEQIENLISKLEAIPVSKRTEKDIKRLEVLLDTRLFNEPYFTIVRNGKGGRERISPIIGKNAAQIIERMQNTKPEK